MRQVRFPPPETHVRWLAPVLILLSLACAAAVAVILLGDTTGPFIGPYGSGGVVGDVGDRTPPRLLARTTESRHRIDESPPRQRASHG